MRDLVYLRRITNALLKQLQPTGRAWQYPDNSDSAREIAVKSDMAADFLYQIEDFISNIIPDNDLFSETDAENWERRLALDYDVDTLTLEQRKAEILRKLSYPGGYKNTLSLEFIQYQLRASLFDVYVYRNPDQSQPANTELIANSVDKEDAFTVSNYYHTFIIAGSTITTQAQINLQRRDEFIRKVLKYKPMNMVCFLLSNINKAEGTFKLTYQTYVCESDELSRQSGYKRATELIVLKEVDGTPVSGYPKAYNVLLSFGSYPAITSTELAQLSLTDYNNRMNAYEDYIEETEAGSNFSDDLVAGYERRKYDPTSCPINTDSFLKTNSSDFFKINDTDLLKINN